MGRFAIAVSAALALLAASPVAAKSSPPVIGYVAAFKGLDRIVDRADFSLYTHVDLAFVTDGSRSAFDPQPCGGCGRTIRWVRGGPYGKTWVHPDGQMYADPELGPLPIGHLALPMSYYGG